MSDKKEPIRILQYIGSLETGGSQSMVMNIYRNIDRSKVQFDFVVDRKGKNDLFYKDEIESLGGKVYVFDEYFKVYNYLIFVRQWKEFFKKHPEYKIIHCHVRSVASIVLKIAKKNGLVTICHSHSTSNGKGIKSIAKKTLQNRIYKNCDYYLACSEESAKWLYGEEITKSDNCMIINNAIDSSKYVFDEKIRKRVRKELGIENKKVLGQIGRIEKVKNYNFSIELLDKLLKEDDTYFLLIIGTGSLEDSIMKKAKELGVDSNIMILKDRKDVPQLLQAMDIFIMPSLYEGLSLALVEAQASGLNCMVSDTISDGIFDKKRVKTMPLADANKWVLSIKKIFSIGVVRDEGIELIKKVGFDVKDVSKEMVDFYQKIAEREKMKILFCLGSMGHGGAERVAANLANYFVVGDDVLIVTTKSIKSEYQLDKRVKRIALDGKSGRKNFVRRTFERIITLRRILKKYHFDIAISFLPEPSFRLMVAKAFLPVKTVISVRNDPNREYDSVAKRLLVKILYTKADGFVFQTLDAKEWFSKNIQEKSVVIPNPVSEEFLCEPYSGNREKRIVTVGRLAEQKNQKMLIDAFCKFHEGHKDFVLEIYGDGPLKEVLQSYIDSLGMNKSIKLMGEASNIKEKIYKAKLFVLTSDYEGMPNALMEAMALGLPCISTDCPIGGPRYLIKENRNGILVGVGNTVELVKAMTRIVNNEKDAKEISAFANLEVSKMAPAIIDRKWEDFVVKVYGGKR